MHLEKSDVSAFVWTTIRPRALSLYPHNGAEGSICQGPEKLNLFDVPSRYKMQSTKLDFVKDPKLELSNAVLGLVSTN